MENILTQIWTSPNFLTNLIIWLCSSALILSVIIDFLLYQENNKTKKVKKSKVATWNMSFFFFLLYLTWVFHIWNIEVYGNLKNIFTIVWLFLVIIWTILNIVWRFYLSTNWANHIKIYDNHTLITYGAYKIVRHPLYASLIWFAYGVWLTYSNWIVLLLNTIIFIPMMIYRAKQEEKLLTERFANYSEYKKKVWMFLPKLF